MSTPEVRDWPVKGMEASWPAAEADQQGQSALVQLEQERAREWSWPLRGCNMFVAAGEGYPGSVEDADQQSRLHLVGASGTGRGTHASSVAGPSHQGDTSVSQELCKEEVASPVMANKGPSGSDLCENGTGAAKSVIPRKGPNCVNGEFSIIVAGIRLSFKTSANGLAEHGPKVVPCNSEAKG